MPGWGLVPQCPYGSRNTRRAPSMKGAAQPLGIGNRLTLLNQRKPSQPWRCATDQPNHPPPEVNPVPAPQPLGCPTDTHPWGQWVPQGKAQGLPGKGALH